MLEDPRSQALATRFASQWLRLQDLEKVSPDIYTFPYFDLTLAHAMRRETELFFEDLAREDGSLLELLTADYTFVAGRPVRRCRAPMTRGLNRNYNRVLKDVFKGAATAATGRPGPLQDFYHGMIARGMREELARVTLTRKLAAITLRLWKKGKRYDPTQLTMQAR